MKDNFSIQLRDEINEDFEEVLFNVKLVEEGTYSVTIESESESILYSIEEVEYFISVGDWIVV